jgi:hypothetical protein
MKKPQGRNPGYFAKIIESHGDDVLNTFFRETSQWGVQYLWSEIVFQLTAPIKALKHTCAGSYR